MDNKTRIRIGIFGAELESVNFGCAALAYSQLELLRKLRDETGKEIECWIFSDDSVTGIEKAKRITKINNLQGKYLVRIKTGLPGMVKLNRDINACDLIIDLTYGDSFSDIYGKKNFYLYSIPKLISIKNKKKLVLGPQTIGPFYSKAVEHTARYILRKADKVIVRDRESLRCAEDLVIRNDIAVSSDLAMMLPYDRRDGASRIEGRLNVGLNVSLLMWEKGSSSRLKLSLDYQCLITNLIEVLQKTGAAVHLIAHVYDKKEFSEYSLAKELNQKFKGTVLAPEFTDPIEAKNYISGLDVFIGSRMHATIGAFSSGVPVIPLSYSRKFEGLYGALGYDHCVDCTKETQAGALTQIMRDISGLELLTLESKDAFKKALEMNKIYFDILKEYLTCDRR